MDHSKSSGNCSDWSSFLSHEFGQNLKQQKHPKLHTCEPQREDSFHNWGLQRCLEEASKSGWIAKSPCIVTGIKSPFTCLMLMVIVGGAFLVVRFGSFTIVFEQAESARAVAPFDCFATKADWIEDWEEETRAETQQE